VYTLMRLSRLATAIRSRHVVTLAIVADRHNGLEPLGDVDAGRVGIRSCGELDAEVDIEGRKRTVLTIRHG